MVTCNAGRGRRGDERVTESVTGTIFVGLHELMMPSKAKHKNGRKSFFVELLQRRIFYAVLIFVLPLWKTMTHLTNHMTQHRSEIAMKLTEWRHSPGELGMNYYFN